MKPLLEAALNGSRTDEEHPGIPRTPEELAAEGRAAVEAGARLLRLEDAQTLVSAGIAQRCSRVLLEPLDPGPLDAVAHAAAMERALAEGKVGLEPVHHGDGRATWHVMERAVARGHGIRVGLEDTTVLPDGRPAGGNGELVRAAAAMLPG